MLMPDNFEIREDGTLVIIVNEVEYEFKEKDDFIYSDKKKIILKHHAVINLSLNANIKVGPPMLLSSHSTGCFVFSREATLSDGTRFSAIGEANDVRDNLWSEYLQQYMDQIKKYYASIAQMRERLNGIKQQLQNSEDFQAEINRIDSWFKDEVVSFDEFDDNIVRYLVESIRVTDDSKIVINVKGGGSVTESLILEEKSET